MSRNRPASMTRPVKIPMALRKKILSRYFHSENDYDLYLLEAGRKSQTDFRSYLWPTAGKALPWGKNMKEDCEDYSEGLQCL